MAVSSNGGNGHLGCALLVDKKNETGAPSRLLAMGFWFL
jgi:hypothetical protein